MINSSRLTRNKNPPSFPERLDALTRYTDQRLTPKCKLEDFREFFDFKVGPWKSFHRQLKEHVLLSSTWGEIQENSPKREAVATTFLEQVGFEYWGNENREKYLIEEHVQTGDVCVYPRDKKTMIKALAFLLEKDSKNRRESVSQEVPQTQSSSLSDPPASEFEMTSPMKQSSSGASTPTGLFRIPQTVPTPKTPQSPQATRSARGTSVVGAERAPKRPASTTPTPMTRGRLEAAESTEMVSPALATRGTPSQEDTQLMTRERLDAAESTGMVSSALVTQGTPSQENTRLCCQGGYMGIAEAFFTQFSDIAPNTLATYFLVHEYGSQREPVCVPFHNFEDYRTTDDFLDEMEKRCCCEHDPSLLQLFEGVRQFSHAAVSLQWSGISFVMRRETDDLRSLATRIGCAWRAKEEGELPIFEFVIRVTLKKD